MPYVFGPFRADLAAYRVFKGTLELALTPKPLDLLFYFLARPGTPAEALASFRSAREHVTEFVRATIGEAAALAQLGESEAADARRDVELGRTHLERTGRTPEALLVRACEASLRGDSTAAVASLEQFLTIVPPSHVGWTIPIEPCFRGLAHDSQFKAVLPKLADRAR